MPSVNNIELIGRIVNDIELVNAEDSYLQVQLQTHDIWYTGTQHQAVFECHTLRLYGLKADYYQNELEPNDMVYVYGSIKSTDTLKYISVQVFELLFKRSPGDLLPPDVALDSKAKWS